MSTISTTTTTGAAPPAGRMPGVAPTSAPAGRPGAVGEQAGPAGFAALVAQLLAGESGDTVAGADGGDPAPAPADSGEAGTEDGADTASAVPPVVVPTAPLAPVAPHLASTLAAGVPAAAPEAALVVDPSGHAAPAAPGDAGAPVTVPAGATTTGGAGSGSGQGAGPDAGPTPATDVPETPSGTPGGPADDTGPAPAAGAVSGAVSGAASGSAAASATGLATGGMTMASTTVSTMPGAAVASPAPPPPAVSQVVPEVTRLVSRGNGVHRLTMLLQPEALGEVRVTLTVRDGAVQVQLSGGGEAVRALTEGAPELRRVLELAGASEARVVVRDLAGQAASPAPAATGTGSHDTSYDPRSSAGGDTPSPGGDAAQHDRRARTHGGPAATDGVTDGATAPRPDQVGGARQGIDLTM